ncbi:AAA family ATPase [Streptomyces lunaelactis]|uniref:ATP-binding protein n=3 Tax=Streptomyces lunaelactis TaxID=1535768 RepID=UPI0015849239|nr:AAA family ATPase [Streptomyces lunaelactis]NUK10215.1 AAA family ATPase [Streptomyces lunaelactis]NUK36551.1 AAA family ATPase [Streptomyces lunaelactis]NUK42735.1 AAA family ATPase [Streptomyces lunaelactis]NUK52645.1 AAA family ATPase [Streptomyces lunaelactis]NUK59600.1 AAA family ATPase [Streptomyces lunaelactis]
MERGLPAYGEWPVVGRADELAALDAVADEVLSERTRVVLLDGHAGIGKSALLHFWLDQARKFHILRVRCRQLERDFAFGTVRRLLQPLMAATADSDRRSLLEGAGDTVLRILDPENCRNDDGPDGCSDATETLLGLDNLAFRLSRRQPLLLAIDDLQWIDPPSLRWLARLVHRADAHPILVAATTRTGEKPAPGHLFNDLVHPSTCRSAVLEPLGVQGVEKLVSAVFGADRPDPSFCAACHAATDGNPLFLRALLCDARRSGVQPTRDDREKIRTFGLHTLSREIGHRLGHGSEDMAALARGLAILGDHKPPALLAAYCSRGEAVIRSAAAELHSSGLLRAGDGLRFVHPVVREVVLAQWPPQEIGEAHARAAHVLHLSGRPDEEVAAHLLAAGPVPGHWVLTVLRRAAGEALRRGAAEAAVTYLRHAVHQPVQPGERAQVLLQLAVAASHYDTGLAVSYGTAALEGLTDDSARSEAVGVLTYSHLLSRGTAYAPDLDHLTAELSVRADLASSDREPLLRMHALRSWLEFERPSTRAEATASRAVLDTELAGNTPGERQLLAIRAFNALRAAQPAPYIAEMVDRTSVNLPTFSHDLFPLHYFVAQALLYLDELDKADHLCTHLLRETRGRGLELLASSLLVYRAGISLRRGDIGKAAAAARAASEGPSAAGERPYTMTMDTIRIDTLLEQGDLEAAEHIAGAYSAADPTDVSWEWPRFLMSLAALRTARGDVRAGLSLLRECGHHFDAAGTVNPVICPWRSRAAAAQLALGRHGDARALIEQELDLARNCRIPRALGVALLAAGGVAGGARGLEHLAEAVSLLERTPAHLELARALHEYGSALLRRDDKNGARQALRRGLDIAVRCGASSLAGRLQKRLYDAGGRVGSRGAYGCSLTAGEERVTALAAQGYSNKQIAERLFVSLRTVETHLTGAYRKLRITGRSELVAVLGDISSRGPRDPHAEG